MLGLGMSGFGTILGAVDFITTIITMRAPGMTMWRMPIFSWNTLVTSILVLMAFPVLAAAILAAASDRVHGASRRGLRPADGWTWQNQVSTIGAIILGASMIPFLLNVWITSRKAPKVTVNDPWGYGHRWNGRRRARRRVTTSPRSRASAARIPPST
jgi:heme/copper-type cytochrome/quinol oxidase subunit 1